MAGYIYLTTNLINGRKYIGKKHSSVFLKNYKGSGKIIKQALKKYGKENFKVELICFCETIDELNKMERYYIKLYNADISDDFYNIAVGGEGFGARGKNNGMYGRKRTKEEIEKIKKTQMERGVSRGKNNPMFGRKRTEEEREKISKTLKKNKTTAGENNPMFGKGYLHEGGKNPSAKKTKIIFPDGNEIEFDCGKAAAIYLSENYGISVSMAKQIWKYKDGYKPNKSKFKNLEGVKILKIG